MSNCNHIQLSIDFDYDKAAFALERGELTEFVKDAYNRSEAYELVVHQIMGQLVGEVEKINRWLAP